MSAVDNLHGAERGVSRGCSGRRRTERSSIRGNAVADGLSVMTGVVSCTVVSRSTPRTSSAGDRPREVPEGVALDALVDHGAAVDILDETGPHHPQVRQRRCVLVGRRMRRRADELDVGLGCEPLQGRRRRELSGARPEWRKSTYSFIVAPQSPTPGACAASMRSRWPKAEWSAREETQLRLQRTILRSGPSVSPSACPAVDADENLTKCGARRPCALGLVSSRCPYRCR